VHTFQFLSSLGSDYAIFEAATTTGFKALVVPFQCDKSRGRHYSWGRSSLEEMHIKWQQASKGLDEKTKAWVAAWKHKESK
jgi:hypothetical protein